MGGSRGLMGPEAFAQLRISVDAMIAEKVDGLAPAPSAAGFLAAHPVGCVYMTTIHTNPGTLYGGTWVERPSTGAFLYERTE